MVSIMKDYFENTTQITEEGYAAILRIRHDRQRMACHGISLVLAAPFLGRLIYTLVLLCTGSASQVRFRPLDVLFLLLLIVAVWVWHYPQTQIRTYLRRTRKDLDLHAVHQYAFFPDHLQMMTTATQEKYELGYHAITWVKSDWHWIVLYFALQQFTMLVDRNGFTYGTAEACLRFLRGKIQKM